MNDDQPKPCKCGIKHQKDDGNYEFFYMKMTAPHSPVQVPPRKTARCKFCKEVLLVERIDERKKEESVLESIFLKDRYIPSAFTNTFGN
jgi:hypothetical protein